MSIARQAAERRIRRTYCWSRLTGMPMPVVGVDLEVVAHECAPWPEWSSVESWLSDRPADQYVKRRARGKPIGGEQRDSSTFSSFSTGSRLYQVRKRRCPVGERDAVRGVRKRAVHTRCAELGLPFSGSSSSVLLPAQPCRFTAPESSISACFRLLPE